MLKQAKEKLLQDSRVVEEINRHKWFESQRVGHDIGFEKAAEDWIKKFSTEWLKKNSKSPACSAMGKKPCRGAK
jgi:hypothetical protein